MVADAAQASDAESKARIFISYSRKDMAFADRLEAGLRARGFEPLIDREEIYAFEDWWKRIEALIGRADTVVFVLSPDAIYSDVALKEVAYAASLNKRLAPIVYRQVQDDIVPEGLRRLNFIFFDDPAHFDASADRLAEALQTDIDWIRQHTKYGEGAYYWLEAGRPNGLLLHSPTLEVAEHWLVSRPREAPAPTVEIQAFIAASRQGARAVRRLWRLVLASIFTLLVGIIIGLVGWINQAYIKERINWYVTMRPYMLTNFRPYVLTREAERALKPNAPFRECAKDCPEMVVVPSGEFTMGSPKTEEGRYNNEGPQHKVAIAKSFAVAKFDVTFDEWDACSSVGGCPQVKDSGYGRKLRPVINITWDEAQQYVTWLSMMTGRPYRLLTEAEWEYAARAGSPTAYYWGEYIGKQNASCDGCGNEWDNRKTSPVGSFKRNAFGLYDMAGNVWEWVQDCYHDDYNGAPSDDVAWTSGDCARRVARGGSWDRLPPLLRTASRIGNSTVGRNLSLGFRVARTLLPP
jgi:formylglycine-generating enzyme required for sulfatase activity